MNIMETTKTCPTCNGPVASNPPFASTASGLPGSDRRILPAFILVLLFGVFGAHRFYAGKIGTAILQLCTCGGLGVWSMIDLILIVCGAFTDDRGQRITQWT
jgi:hypothetical protein